MVQCPFRVLYTPSLLSCSQERSLCARRTFEVFAGHVPFLFGLLNIPQAPTLFSQSSSFLLFFRPLHNLQRNRPSPSSRDF